MTKQPDKKPAAKVEASGEPEVTANSNDTGDTETTDTGVAEAAPDAEEKEPEAEPEASPEEQIVALNDRLLRVVAEMENFRRRAERERQDTAKFAITGFARDCLTVLDNLRRGLDSVSAEERAAVKPLETLAAGMELTERELITTLERHGIEKIDPLGEPFDYHRHQAMFEIEDENQPAGTVVQVAQVGYMLHDRLLRAAMVAVAKGGPKPGTDGNNGGDEDTKAASELPQNEAGEGGEAGKDNPGGAKPSHGVEGDDKPNT